MTDITPFKIAVPDSEIDALKAKLALTRFPDELEDAEWEYGPPLADIKRLVRYWQEGYDWRVHEKQFNDTLPQFTTDVEVKGFGALNLHFVHKKSEVKNAIPLLFIHGCMLVSVVDGRSHVVFLIQGREASLKSPRFFLF
jgi:hypothetical protein